MSDRNYSLEIGSGSLPALVFVALLVLKLTVRPDIRWLWVFAPLWIPACIAVGIAILFVLVYVVYMCLMK